MNIMEKYSQNNQKKVDMIILSFVVLVIGGLNWLSIGMLQYDFIAGFFGTQANIFSRLVYIGIGVACIFVVFDMLKNKGKILLFGRKKQEQNDKLSTKQDILGE